jgi:MraZ protein
MAVWLEVEQRLAGMPSSHPSKIRFLERVNFFGQSTAMDNQGRIVIPPLLRESTAMAGEVSVLGQQNFLAVWNQKRLQERFEKDPFTDEDGRLLAEHGI